ncbi:MAG: DNA repair protein RadA [Deferribacteraceae bacterium]|jgi:DNA repair protein RadA/Sms|nr:DNA repair protein RadA [Deferribacteraceae bacterium]
MAKEKIQYVCSNCGSVSPKWMGRCPDCSGWNTFSEEITGKKTSSAQRHYTPKAKPVRLNDIKGVETIRFPTGMSELDLVLGGGAVKGSVVLTGGEPGIGKSTIMLQIAGILSGSDKKLLYVSGEESAEQIKMRAERLRINYGNVQLLITSSFEDILATLEADKYSFVMIDSIQTIVSAELASSGGTVGQVRHITYRLVEIAKATGLTVFIVGQVTKEGSIAGPKTLEHLVDTVLYFEGDYSRGIRLLRTVKNRFGSNNEVGLFEMTERGLAQVGGDLFIQRSGGQSSGQAICPVMEGTRPFLVEIQALVTPTFFQFPRRNSTGFDPNRLQMLAAVLEKRGGLSLSGADIYLNVAGGLKITEPAADLAVCAALASSFKDSPLDSNSVFAGEVGLSGEIRPVSNMTSRIGEAVRLGAKTIYLPNDIDTGGKIKPQKVKNIRELIMVINKN